MRQEVLGVKAPKAKCTDKNCPFHGQLAVKKELFKGKVVKKDINRSATIEWFRSVKVPKYERYEIKRSRMRTHNPACIDAKIGQDVIVARTRPLSKTKNHVIIEVISECENNTLAKKKEKVKPKKEIKQADAKQKVPVLVEEIATPAEESREQKEENENEQSVETEAEEKEDTKTKDKETENTQH